MASRAIDLLITYRIVKLLVKPFDKQEAFKYGIIDKDGNVLKKFKTLKTEKERKAYTILHRFVFNLKRILKRVGLGGRLGSFAVALGISSYNIPSDSILLFVEASSLSILVRIVSSRLLISSLSLLIEKLNSF